MLTDTEVDHIAKLARIDLAPEMRERMKKDLSAVLDYIALLDEADTAGVDPLYQVTGLQNRTRDDAAERPVLAQEYIDERLVQAAPHHAGRYVRVKQVKAK